MNIRGRAVSLSIILPQSPEGKKNKKQNQNNIHGLLFEDEELGTSNYAKPFASEMKMSE